MTKDYKCSKCGIGGVKMWREWNSFSDPMPLTCVRCSAKLGSHQDQYEMDGLPFSFRWKMPGTAGHISFCDQNGGCAPAVANEDGEFYSYSAVPTEAIMKWYELPTYPDPADDLIVERALRAEYMERSFHLRKHLNEQTSKSVASRSE